MQKNPWKTNASSIRYENPWFRVREDQVTRPDGKPGIYGVIETRIATGVVALTEQREVILVGQYRYPTECYSWEIVEGGAEKNEDPLAAIQRELKEETGYLAKNWIQLGPPVHLSNCISSEVAMLYLAEDLLEGSAEPDGTEILQVKKLLLSECLTQVRSGLITDAMSIIGLERAAQHLENI